MSIFRRLTGRSSGSPQPVGSGAHRDEVEAFIASIGMMNRMEVAQVHQQGLTSGAARSDLWTLVVAHIVAQASIRGLGKTIAAAQHRASSASSNCPGRVSNQYVVADSCAGVWAEVLVLRDYMPRDVIATAFEPWRDVLEAPLWL